MSGCVFYSDKSQQGSRECRDVIGWVYVRSITGEALHVFTGSAWLICQQSTHWDELWQTWIAEPGGRSWLAFSQPPLQLVLQYAEALGEPVTQDIFRRIVNGYADVENGNN